jgi:hypothetical protein
MTQKTSAVVLLISSSLRGLTILDAVAIFLDGLGRVKLFALVLAPNQRSAAAAKTATACAGPHSLAAGPMQFARETRRADGANSPKTRLARNSPEPLSTMVAGTQRIAVTTFS